MADNAMLAFAQACLGGTGTDEGILVNAAFARFAKGISSVSSTGAITWQSVVQNVVSAQPATVTLTAAQSGSICLFDSAAGIVYTLPAPTVGMNFTFVVTTSVTSNNHKVITNAGTVLLAGSLWNAVAAGTGTQFIANASTHIAVTQNSTNTSGGLIGSIVYFYALTSTLWMTDGVVLGAGTIVTPYATS